MTRYGTDIDNAIREAFARGDRPSEVLVRLRAGTLPGIEAPVPIADRTFWNKWGRAKREQGRGGASNTNGTPSIIDVIGVDLARQALGSDDPSEIAKHTRLGKRVVSACIERMAERDS